MDDVALDRDALYYPYIHIRDVNWLKATLLCFPQVRRVVPTDFYLNDDEEVRPFRTVRGARGQPLLTEEYTDMQEYGSPVHQAQNRLLKVLEDNAALVHSRFSRDVAIRDFPKNPDAFQMHTGKMLWGLADYLVSHELGWFARQLQSAASDTRWVALHPVLGEAIMSMIAIAIARAKGLDIVTSSGRVHHAMAVLDEDEVIDHLLERGTGRLATTPAELADELAEIVLTTRFDVSRLTAEQIAELIKDGKDLRAFKTALIPIAKSLPDVLDPTERERRLREKAKEVIDLWMAYRKSLPRFAVDAIVESTELTVPDVASAMIVGGGTSVALASGWGLALGLLTWKGVGIYRKFQERASDPLRFLSQIEKAGASLVISSRAITPSVT